MNEPTSEVPDNIRPNHLIKELTKEIRYLEVRSFLDFMQMVVSAGRKADALLVLSVINKSDPHFRHIQAVISVFTSFICTIS